MAVRTRAGPWCATASAQGRSCRAIDDRRFKDDHVVGTPAIGRPENGRRAQLHEVAAARVGEATPRAHGYTVHRPMHPFFDGTGSATATCSAPMTGSWPTRSTAASSPRSTDCRCNVRRRHTGRLRGARHRARPLAVDHRRPLRGARGPVGQHTTARRSGGGGHGPLRRRLAGQRGQVAHGHAVMGTSRGRAGSSTHTPTDRFGLDRDPLVQRVTLNVLRQLGGVD